MYRTIITLKQGLSQEVLKEIKQIEEIGRELSQKTRVVFEYYAEK